MTRRFAAIAGAVGVAFAAVGIWALVLAVRGEAGVLLTVLEYVGGISFTVSGAVLIVAVWIAFRDRNWISSESGNGRGPDA